MNDHSSDNGGSRWTTAAAFALAEYYEELEQSTGEQMELDVVSIRCDWTEYATLQEVMEYYNPQLRDSSPDEILEYLNDHTQVITLPNDLGYLVLQF